MPPHVATVPPPPPSLPPFLPPAPPSPPRSPSLPHSQQSTVQALQEEVEARATIDGLDEIMKQIRQKMKTRADFLNRQLEQRATLIDFDTLKSQLFESIKDENAKSVERLDLIDEQMSYDQSQFASLQEEVSAKATLTQVNAVLEKIEFLATKEEQEGVEKE